MTVLSLYKSSTSNFLKLKNLLFTNFKCNWKNIKIPTTVMWCFPIDRLFYIQADSLEMDQMHSCLSYASSPKQHCSWEMMGKSFSLREDEWSITNNKAAAPGCVCCGKLPTQGSLWYYIISCGISEEHSKACVVFLGEQRVWITPKKTYKA